MDHSNIRTFKRPLDIPTREQLAAIFNPPKRSRNTQSLDSPSIPRGTHYVNDENVPTSFNMSSTIRQNNLDANGKHPHYLPPFDQNQSEIKNNAPLLNSVPPDIVPIVHPPAITSDFFTDVTTDLSNENTAEQIYGILKKFPPPIPPPAPLPEIYGDVSDDERGGIMVPFIYPPPPVVNIDKLPFSLTQFRRKFQNSINELEDRENKANDRESPEKNQTREGSSFSSKEIDKQPLADTEGQVQSECESKAASAAHPPAPGPAKRGRKPKIRPEQIQAKKEEEEAKAKAKAKAGIEAEVKENERKQSLHPAAPADGMSNEKRDSQSAQPNNTSAVAGAGPVEENDRYVYVQAPPLPFPPANYMAYPLSAQKSSLVPDDVFTSLLEANEELPRVDMVVASAAGSLFDLRKEALEKGLTRDDFERQKLQKEVVEIFSDDSSDGDVPTDNERYSNEDYYSKIDDEVYQDVYQAQWPKVNIFNKSHADPQYSKVNSQLSNVKNKPIVDDKQDLEDVYSYPFEAMTGLERIDRSNVFPAHSQDFLLSTGTLKEKRRKNLRTHLENIEEFEQRNRDDIYRAKKYKLLQRIDNLHASKIHFRNSVIRDEELKETQHRLEIERDYELVKLKLFEKYELLKNSMIFYEDSNKVYKHLNMILINRLEKLKNFFEYQHELFTHMLEQSNRSGGGADVFDISNKNSSKLFQGISHANEDKSISAASSSSDEANGEAGGQLKHASESDKLLNEMLNSSSKFALVHDFMPLITQEEFNIITSDVPKKLKPSTSTKMSMKHQIFANPIYDRLMTSGSDTNASDSNATGFKSGSPQPQSSQPGPKRRGRRAATAATATTTTTTGQSNIPPSSLNGTASAMNRSAGGSSLTTTATAVVAPTMQNTYMRDSVAFNHRYTEAGLLAKITKQFYGPQSANSDELNHDLQLMGIDSRWPVGK
ncbi:hypothetical protein CANMA_001109 [Candida margitis]|uniref:uncharacterized protein n=1 Tax=Candida margitis TaxID=1775924 RepID=UPI00222794B6|nr:uncharacterized protein CANMA_001109 [Candida margitis]KAI5969819.1 hypothetical protein CANMA_001109 [Candida margitis]